MLNILIAGQQSLYLEGIKSILGGFKNAVVLNIVQNISDVFSLLSKHIIDVLVIDISINSKNGIFILGEVRLKFPKLNIVVLTINEINEEIILAQKLGANAYLNRNTGLSELRKAIYNFKPNNYYLCENLVQLNNKGEETLNRISSTNLVTPREHEIIALIFKGLTAVKIAQKLNISPKTVDTHRKNILRKFEFHKISQLMNYAIKNNLIDFNE